MELRVSLCIAAQVLSVALSPQPVGAGSKQPESTGQGSICEIDETHEKCGVTLPVESGAELPFRLSAGYLIMVEGQIGAQRNLRFILDTGATMSIVDKKIADKLKLSRHPIESFNFDRKLTWEQAEFPEVQFGPVKATKIAMLVGHLAEYSEFARNADAIIGTDLLKLSNFSIDYETRRIVFHLRGLESSAARGEPLSDCLTLEVLVQGHPVRLIVDTGLPGILLYEERLLKSVPGLQLTGKVINVTMGGRLPAKQVTLHGIAIGPTDKDVSVLLMKSPPPDMLPGIVGIVGIAALNARWVNLDFARGTLSWEGRQSAEAALQAFSEIGEGDSEVPFTIEDGYLIVVEARIGERRRVKFALDTGATYSVLRANTGKGLENARQPVRVVNLDRVLTQESVNVGDFQLGPIRIPQLAMMKNDLQYLRESAPQVEGLIGLDVLRLRSFSIDFHRRKINFGAQRLLRSSAPMEIDRSYMTVEVRMLDRPVHLLVDTGVRSILLYRDRVGERLPNVKVEERIRGTSLSGEASLEVVTLPRLQLNGTELERRGVLLRTSPEGFLPGVDGYLSIAALGAWRVSFDFERSRLSWE